MGYTLKTKCRNLVSFVNLPVTTIQVMYLLCGVSMFHAPKEYTLCSPKISSSHFILLTPCGDLYNYTMVPFLLFIVLILSVQLVAKNATMQVLSSMKHEQTFSTLSFMNSKLRNKLNDHLKLVVEHIWRTTPLILEFPL
jgi:hypothetical protein